MTQVLSDGTNTYLYGVNRISQQHDATLTEYFLADALGSVRQLTDSGGEVVLARAYDPYGSLVENNAYDGVTTPYGYTGEYTDAASGMVYLRARYYNPAQGRFVSRDVWEGDEIKPLSYNSWVYAYSNPTNIIDPSGMYGIQVHYHLTRALVDYWASVIPISGIIIGNIENFGKVIGDWDQHVDQAPLLLPVNPLGIPCHFMDYDHTIAHVEESISSRKIYLFGAALHQLQDYFSHWNEGYTILTGGHAWDSYINRSEDKLSDFFNGYHWDESVTPAIKIPSLYPAHPKEDVIRVVKKQNPSLIINSQISDWQLIDLYLRNDNDDLSWTQKKDLRGYFGFNTDDNIPDSYREQLMKNTVDNYVHQFIQELQNEEKCSIPLIDPNQAFPYIDTVDHEIRSLLTKY
ncbi:MAG: RHS repeat-associated core domain-containing protein [Anaerolineales bacterium]|nr:RHS repeat-associated core domain-containing protein [Anaerolineales bacterium]